ncbi:MAG: DinB family protein [Vicinamibacterales bacterium]
MDLHSLRDLYRHMEWADATVWPAVLASDSAREDEKLRGLLTHLHLVQHAFLRQWRGEPRDAPYPTFTALAPLKSWAREYHIATPAFLDTLTDARLTEPMPVAWAHMVEKAIGRPPATTTLGETVLQVALHSQYHRGQVNMRLRELGGVPPLVDYIAWLWFGRPAAEWE